MTPQRQRELECTDAHLTFEEWKDGYHYCDEFDGLVTQGELFNLDGITCICGFDKRKVYEYTAQRSVERVGKLTVDIVERALEEMFGEKK